MADKIRIHTGRLGNDAARIYDCIRHMAGEVRAMQDSADTLKSMWEGAGSAEFYKSFRSDTEALEAVIRQLQEMYAYDSNAKKEYETCEKKIASMIGDLRV